MWLITTPKNAQSSSARRTPQLIVGVCTTGEILIDGSGDSGNYFTTDPWTGLPLDSETCIEDTMGAPGVGGGGAPPAPGPVGGTADGCAAYASMCYLIDGDDANVISYATGQNGLYTVDPTNCQNSGSGWFSTTDAQPCSPWQVFFYNGVYTGNTQDVAIKIPVTVWYELATANSDYPSQGPTNTQVLNGGHLYLALLGYGLAPFPIVIQGGKNSSGDGKLAYIPGPQGNAVTDFRLPIALSPTNAAAVYLHLQSLAGTYDTNYRAGFTPYYNPLLCNSNRWAHNLMNADGFLDLQLDLYEAGLAKMSENTRVPYGGFGPLLCDVTAYFLGPV
jgi:hypothetical protein